MESVPASESVLISIENGTLDADLQLTPQATGLVIFAHGSGSSRFSSRNRRVAESLQVNGFATLILDLLTRVEESIDNQTAEYRFDIDRLCRRVVRATDWAVGRPDLRQLPLGYFGASTGAAAALLAAAERPEVVRAVVSRGGRPELAGDALREVQAPTLLIVGENDTAVVRMNRDAMRRMTATVELRLVPRATHLFEEAGTMDQVMDLANGWFSRYLRA